MYPKIVKNKRDRALVIANNEIWKYYKKECFMGTII